MRTLLCSSALLALSALPASAGDWYGQLQGGVIIGPNYDFDLLASDFAPGPVSGSFETDTGLLLGGAIGKYLTDNFRTELEIAYREVGVDTVVVDSLVVGFGSETLDARALMLNGYFDFGVGGPVTPYVGAGVGAARVGDDSRDTVFAYQGMAGVALPLSESTAIGAEYRYFQTTDPVFERVNLRLNLDYSSHSVLGFVRFRF